MEPADDLSLMLPNFNKLIQELKKLHDAFPFIVEFKIENDNIPKDGSIFEENLQRFDKDAQLYVNKVLNTKVEDANSMI